MHGIVLGIGGTGRDGGTAIIAGHTTGTGVTATHSIITIITALSVRDVTYTTAIMSYTVV